MNRYAIWVANSGLFGLCCFLLAGMIAEVSAARLAPDSPAAIQAAIPAGPRLVRPDHGQIVARNLFNSTEIAATVAPEPEPEEDLQETKLPLRLLGTAASDDTALAWAAIDDLDERKHKVVATGGEVKPGVSVVRIDRKRVVLRNNGRLEELTLEEDETASHVVARRPTRPPRANRTALRQRQQNLASRVKQVAENRFEVDNDDVQATVRNPASLFSQARILPRYEEGQMIGVQLNAIKPGSLFERVGLSDGDTIVEFNGQSLGSPADSAQFLQQLIDGNGFEVVVEDSNGAERTLTFEATP
jgi:type II secretion system protein C